ncbi:MULTISPECIES: helix-turn-helix domain-containing protein [Bacilli]|uniref:helix-turn-helix domain-containing protein n=1 Tax=Bacilli TaxID=91061 RepID=UPI002041605D|nr:MULTISPECIES: helix-turn-helix transcriptional regulator [Bacilli]MCM3032931.1 helix-turn-helix transcriptional regulator [Niallia sp. MER 6]MDK8746853.1 helix-turn-helix transcriptional regulator [Streptococcus agalactiae]
MNKIVNFDFGTYLKSKRKNNKLSLLELSNRTEVSKSYISMLENGKTPFPSVKILKKLAPQLGIHSDEMRTLLSYIRDSDIFPEDEPSNADKQQSKLILLDVEGLDETEIEKIKEQIELYKLRNKINKDKKDKF